MKTLCGTLLALPLLGASSYSQEEKAGDGEAKNEILNVMRCPGGGVRPVVQRDGLGILHMIYLGAEAPETDLYYLRSNDGGGTFSEPMRVNSHPGGVDASDLSRGANMGLGRDGRVHLVWVGSPQSTAGLAPEARGPEGEAPLMYSQLSDDKKSFSVERNLIQSHWGLLATPAVAADTDKSVYVFWHAKGDEPPEDKEKMNDRRIWMTASTDGGKTFGAERPIDRKRKGVAETCGLDAEIDGDGTIYVLYRCSQSKRKDMRLLYSPSAGEAFGSSYVDTWRRRNPPRTAGAIKVGHNRLMVSWETEGQVFASIISRKTYRVLRPMSPKSKPEEVWRQQPCATSSDYNVTMIAWLEGEKGKPPSRIGWRTYNNENYSPIDRGFITDIPPDAKPEIFVRPDNNFTIVY